MATLKLAQYRRCARQLAITARQFRVIFRGVEISPAFGMVSALMESHSQCLIPRVPDFSRVHY